MDYVSAVTEHGDEWAAHIDIYRGHTLDIHDAYSMLAYERARAAYNTTAQEWIDASVAYINYSAALPRAVRAEINFRSAYQALKTQRAALGAELDNTIYPSAN